MRNKIKFILSVSMAASLLLSFSQASARDSKFVCSTQGGKQVCVLQNSTVSSTETTTSSNSSTDKNHPILQKLQDVKIKERQKRIESIAGVYKAQIDRAQKAIDRMQTIIDRIKAQRAKMTTGSTTDLADLDALIAKAETQKKDADTALADVKAKADAIKATLNTIKTDTNNSADTSTANIANLKQQVKDFQTSVKALKKSLITLHSTLQQTVKKMRIIIKGSNETPTPNPTPEPTPTPTSTNNQENQ